MFAINVLEYMLLWIIIDRIRSIEKGNVFTGVCLFTGGGVPLKGGGLPLESEWDLPLEGVYLWKGGLNGGMSGWGSRPLPAPAVIRSTASWYASIWNAFLFHLQLLNITSTLSQSANQFTNNIHDCLLLGQRRRIPQNPRKRQSILSLASQSVKTRH